MSTEKTDLRFDITVKSSPLANKVDWSKAPAWANWVVYSRSAEMWIYWYAQEPKPDGTWAGGPHSREVTNPMEYETVIEHRPQPPQPVTVCPDCGQSHENQRMDYPQGAKVLATTKITQNVIKGQIGRVLDHTDDGRAVIAFESEKGITHTFHYPETALVVWANDPSFIPPFPRGVRLIIDVVFPREYRIGYEYENVVYIPGTPSYFPFAEAMQRCWTAFCDRFPQ